MRCHFKHLEQVKVEREFIDISAARCPNAPHLAEHTRVLMLSVSNIELLRKRTPIDLRKGMSFEYLIMFSRQWGR